MFALPTFLTACGSSKHGTSAPVATPTVATQAATTPASTTTAASSPAAPGALRGEALSTAAGDIPDNQVFVRYAGRAFSMKVPEGWARLVSGAQSTFRDKNNIARVVVQPGDAPTVASFGRELARQSQIHITTAPHTVTLAGTALIAATYTATSAPNAVTGKSVTLMVDRYEFAQGGKRDIVDLGTPVGVDNVDAYRLMIESLRLR